MLVWLTQVLSNYLHLFHVFEYITFRAIVSALTALIIVLFFSPTLIKKLVAMQIGQVVRDDGPQAHLKKTGTPTMGGVLMLIAITVSVLLWGDLSNAYIWTVLLVTVACGVIGWIDDYRKVVLRNSKGLPARWKFLLQSLVAAIAAVFLYLLTLISA